MKRCYCYAYNHSLNPGVIQPRFEFKTESLLLATFCGNVVFMHVLSRRAYLVLLAGDISILYLSVWVTLFLRYFKLPNTENTTIHLVSFSILFIPWFIVYFIFGLYSRYTILFKKQLPKMIFVTQAINVILAALFFFFIPFFNITPKIVLVIYLFVSTILLYLWRVNMYPHIFINKEIGALLVGTGKEFSLLAKEVNRDPLYPLEFRAILHPELLSDEEIEKTLVSLINTGRVSTIVADMSNDSLNNLMRFIYHYIFIKRSAEFIDISHLYQEIFERVPLSLITERWILQNMSLNKNNIYFVSKRIMDISLALFVGSFALLLFPFIILAIKLEGIGSIFYITDRIGLQGNPFKFIKFRSMTGTDSGQQVLKTMNTVTKFGKILRRTRLDELPQLWSILKGDMSFVGPRPELPALVSEYKKEIKHYDIRHLVKPGLSGWAQMKHDNHSHGETNVVATTEKLEYDLYYIKKRSLWLDFYIIALTLKTVVFSKGS